MVTLKQQSENYRKSLQPKCILARYPWAHGNVICIIGSSCIAPHPTTYAPKDCPRAIDYIHKHGDSRSTVCLNCGRGFDAEYEGADWQEGFPLHCEKCRPDLCY